MLKKVWNRYLFKMCIRDRITRKRIENAIGGYVTDKKISKVLFEEELTPTSVSYTHLDVYKRHCHES